MRKTSNDLLGKTDHDLLLQIHQAIYEKDIGLKDRVQITNKVLLGNGDFGIVHKLNYHLDAHDEIIRKSVVRERRAFAIFGLIISGIAIFGNRVLSWLGVK